MEKASNKIWEMGNIEMDSESINCEGEISNCSDKQQSGKITKVILY